jgi:UPF0271 protein
LAIREKTGERVLVLDTSGLIMGLDPSALDLPSYTTQSVIDELIPDSLQYTRLRTSQHSGRLIVKKPSDSSSATVRQTSSRVGDVGVLSNADSDVLALALELRESGLSPVIVSDDYAVQNVAEMLDIEHASLATFGITSKFDWVYYCPACFRKYTAKDAGGSCSVCGTRLKRKVIRKEKAMKKVSHRS